MLFLDLNYLYPKSDKSWWTLCKTDGNFHNLILECYITHNCCLLFCMYVNRVYSSYQLELQMKAVSVIGRYVWFVIVYLKKTALLSLQQLSAFHMCKGYIHIMDGRQRDGHINMGLGGDLNNPMWSNKLAYCKMLRRASDLRVHSFWWFKAMENGHEIWNLKFQEPTCSRFKRRIILKWILETWQCGLDLFGSV